MWQSIKKIWREMYTKCDMCEDGRMRYLHTIYLGKNCYEVYRCDRCKNVKKH